MPNQPKKQSNIHVVLIWAGVALVVALILGLMFKNRLLFKPQTDQYTAVTCDFDNGAPCKLPAQQADIFNEKNTARYKYPHGVGVIQPFVKVINGKRYSKTFHLPGWKTYQEEHDNTAREKKVAAKRAEFETMVAWWTTRDPGNLKMLVAVDQTGAIKAADQRLIEDNLGYQRITESVAAGDSLKLTTCVVTDDPHAKCELLVINQNQASRAPEVQNRLQALYAEHKEVPHTALVERLRSELAELNRAKELPDEMIIFSDGMQFYGDVNFYGPQHALLMNKEKWDELKKLVEPEGKQFCDLTGIKVTWFKPVRKMSNEENATVDMAIEFFASLLTDHGATVETITE